MSELLFATEIQSSRDISWDSVVAGIRKYAESQPDELADDLRQWADLLEAMIHPED